MWRSNPTRLQIPLQIAAIALALVLTSVAQGQPQPILVDEHGILSCGDFLGRLDGFLSELRNNPESYGFVIISNPSEKRHRSVIQLEMIDGHVRYRNWKLKQIQYVRADGERDNWIQFWRVPPGASPPRIERSVWSYKLPDSVKEPFLLGVETKMGPQICPDVKPERIFSLFLKENPTARGKIFIRDNSTVTGRRIGEKILARIQKEYGVLRSRFQIITGRLRKPANHDEPVVEYWYLP